jgi:pilus assembly protein Flp/PilA
MKKSFKWRDNRAATAVEYGLLAALIAIAATSAMADVGSHLTTVFKTMNKTLKKAGKS